MCIRLDFKSRFTGHCPHTEDLGLLITEINTISGWEIKLLKMNKQLWKCADHRLYLQSNRRMNVSSTIGIDKSQYTYAFCEPSDPQIKTTIRRAKKSHFVLCDHYGY